MEWIKIDKNNLPEGEVLSANFKPYSYGYKEKVIGYLWMDKGKIVCENSHEVLEGCTHYIDLDKFDL